MNVRKVFRNLTGLICGSNPQVATQNTPPEIVHAHCNECGRKTKHDVVMERKHHASEMVDPHHGIEISWTTTYAMLECRGCEDVSLRRTTWCSEDHPMDEPAQGIYFPPRVSRRKPAWVERLAMPDEYKSLLDEVYVALHADSRRLAAMGARSLIDAYISRRVGDQGNFTAGLNKLVDEDFISATQRDIVNAAVDAGSASAHRGHCPSVNDISAVIDIVENLIHNELLVEPAETLRANTPPRPKPGAASAQQSP